MRLLISTLSAAALMLGACAKDVPAKAETDATLAAIVKDFPVTFSEVAPDVWVHTTNYRLPGQSPISSNGLLVVDGEDVILVDGAWGELATLALLESAKQKLGKPVTKMIITHHHADRIAGVDAAERAGIEIFTHPDTPRLAAQSGFPVPNTSVAALKAPKSRTKVGAVEIAFPGPGHAADNLVVYVPKAKVLYGGCAVRGAGSQSLGNVSDADLTAWPESLAWTKAVYKDAVLVVPGHGKGANLSLLDGTIKLLEEANAESADTPAKP